MGSLVDQLAPILPMTPGRILRRVRRAPGSPFLAWGSNNWLFWQNASH